MKTARHYLFLLGILATTLLACQSGSVENNPKQANTKPDSLSKSAYERNEGIRGRRYCELWIVQGKLNKLEISVFNTLGCNDCPPALWNGLNKEKLRDSLKARFVVMSGPRVFVMDKIGHAKESKPKVSFQGLQFVEMATVPVTMQDVMQGKPKSYKENKIARNTEFIYSKGSKIYQIHNAQHTWIMQSYASDAKHIKSSSDLDNLGQKLKLPAGWKYEVLELENDLIIEPEAGGFAYVLRDDLQNAYLRIK